MAIGLLGLPGVFAHKNVEKRFDQGHELVQILNQRIMVDYVLDLITKKNHALK